MNFPLLSPSLTLVAFVACVTLSPAQTASPWWGHSNERALATPLNSPDAKRLPLISVRGNRFVDPSGNLVLFRGVSIGDPDKLLGQGHWNRELFEQVHAYGATVVRIPVHPIAWRERGVQALLAQADFDIVSKGGYSVLFVGSCVEKVGSAEVDVTVTPYLLRVDLVQVGSNILPVPRFNRPAPPASTPSPLERLSPTIGLENDRRSGVGEKLTFSTDLLHLFTASDRTVDPSNKLMVDGNGSKSLNAGFYTSNLQLAWSRQRKTSSLRSFSLTSSFASDHTPLSAGDYWRNTVRVGGLFLLSPHHGVIRKAAIAGNYRWSLLSG